MEMSIEVKKNIRCIALDLDGTTLSDAKSVSEGNRKALEEAVAVEFVSWWPAGGLWRHFRPLSPPYLELNTRSP